MSEALSTKGIICRQGPAHGVASRGVICTPYGEQVYNPALIGPQGSVLDCITTGSVDDAARSSTFASLQQGKVQACPTTGFGTVAPVDPGGLQFVGFVSAATDVTTLSISGLTASELVDYRITGVIKAAGLTFDNEYVVRPNSLTASQRTYIVEGSGFNVPAEDGRTDITLCIITGQAPALSPFEFEYFNSDQDLAARGFIGHHGHDENDAATTGRNSFYGGTHEIGVGVGVTGFDIVCTTSANGIAQDSWFVVHKIIRRT